MKRISRTERRTPEEAAKYNAVRAQVASELPDLIARHHERVASLDQLNELLVQLKAAREFSSSLSAVWIQSDSDTRAGRCDS